jgi:hypothetical protein
MGFWMGSLIGIGIGIVITPILFLIIYKVKETRTRIKIKKMINQNQFLKPIDKKDYDSNLWEDVYKHEDTEQDLNEFADKMMKRGKFKRPEDE